jgi:asparagine synthase (glutamine-hydrolysing)
MCGIAGYFLCDQLDGCRESILRQMAKAIQYRGPNDEGIWFDNKGMEIGLSHRRLSILDLSKEGHQPMTSVSQRYVIVYNGEVYNYKEIQKELVQDSISWRGHSDTEVILAAFDKWGIEKAIEKFNGMFAFAVWDKKKKALTLCRDRLGVKPLYYAAIGKGLLFGSELKALKAYPKFIPNVDRNSLALYLRYNCIPAPYSIFDNVRKLKPGHFIRISYDALNGEREFPHQTCYWNLWECVESGQQDLFRGDEKDAIEHLESLLLDSVKLRMIADVPLGAFLSGGIDSSTIVALMQIQSSKPIRTFSIGFDNKDYDEAVYAKKVAQHLKTQHTELYVSPKQVLDVIPKLPSIYDEPFSDSSQIPTYIVSKLAQQQVNVCLSGDGGDELFGGYVRHSLVPLIWRRLGRIPPILRKVVASGIQKVPPNTWDNIFSHINAFFLTKSRFNRAGDNIHKFCEILPLKTPIDMYLSLCSHWKMPDSVVLNGKEPFNRLLKSFKYNQMDFGQWMMFYDMLTYLPNDILTKVDRATMAVGLEGRVPLLDHRIVEFSWRLPANMKIKNGNGKWILKEITKKYIPAELVDRPKSGFGIPIHKWIRYELKDWVEFLLDENRLNNQGFFDTKQIRKKWDEHLKGQRNWQYHLWDILMFQAWWEDVGKSG